jgi:hypothetical protein
MPRSDNDHHEEDATPQPQPPAQDQAQERAPERLPRIPRQRDRNSSRPDRRCSRTRIPTPEEWAKEQVKNAPPRSREWARRVARIYCLDIDTDRNDDTDNDTRTDDQ